MLVLAHVLPLTARSRTNVTQLISVIEHCSNAVQFIELIRGRSWFGVLMSERGKWNVRMWSGSRPNSSHFLASPPWRWTHSFSATQRRPTIKQKTTVLRLPYSRRPTDRFHSMPAEKGWNWKEFVSLKWSVYRGAYIFGYTYSRIAEEKVTLAFILGTE